MSGSIPTVCPKRSAPEGRERPHQVSSGDDTIRPACTRSMGRRKANTPQGGGLSSIRIAVVSMHGTPLSPTTPAKARKLLRRGETMPKRDKLGTFYLQLIPPVGTVISHDTVALAFVLRGRCRTTSGGLVQCLRRESLSPSPQPGPSAQVVIDARVFLSISSIYIVYIIFNTINHK
ncbi:hypothetical protein SAMN00768000_3800 [Sulfobacillus thermosulfidooxidans DSM 9293]|uniref:Uncharacterized protein n=2 Tax=Sulfobacillus thermosulfidooxidans TaxID=28034 RepID=A0A1W1WPW6_SULTA|nr:hypothetical protein SAMN00768000_3800 [Sulfobacillus thermosulfidooxidans DSM 9293]